MDLSQFTHKVLMLRPMSTGVGGFVRLMNRRGHVAAEIHVRGLGREGVRVWLLAGEEPAELGGAEARHGEAVLHAEFSARSLAEEGVQAIAVLRDDASRGPLLLGLISGPETMTAARTACLALSKRLREDAQPLAHGDATPVEAPHQNAGKISPERSSGGKTAAKKTAPEEYPSQKNMAETPSQAKTATTSKNTAGEALSAASSTASPPANVPAPLEAPHHNAGKISPERSSGGKTAAEKRAPEEYPSRKNTAEAPSQAILHHNAPLSHRNAPPSPAGVPLDAAPRLAALLHSVCRSGSPTSRPAATTCAPFTAAYRRPGRNVFTLRRSVPAGDSRLLPMEEIRRAMDAAGKLSRQAEGKKRRHPGKDIPGEELLRDARFPAIDPLPYVAAEDAPPQPAPDCRPAIGPQTCARAMEDVEQPGRAAADTRPAIGTLPRRDPAEPSTSPCLPVPADALPEPVWPPQFQSVREMFLRCLPCGRFRLPGWRFVRASAQEEGLWIGRQAVEGRVIRIAYIQPGPPEEGSEYQPLTGTDGKPYRALVQRA